MTMFAKVVVSMCLLIATAQCSPHNSLEEEYMESVLSNALVNELLGHTQEEEDPQDLNVSSDRA